MNRTKATLISSRLNGTVRTWWANGLLFIDDRRRLAGYVVRNGMLLERVTGAEYVTWGIQYIETH